MHRPLQRSHAMHVNGDRTLKMKKEAESMVQEREPRQTRNNIRKKRYKPRVFRDWCKSCGICSSFCPKNVIGHDETGAPKIERPEECIGCGFCELHCPDFAIDIKEDNAIPEENEL